MRDYEDEAVQWDGICEDCGCVCVWVSPPKAQNPDMADSRLGHLSYK